MRFSVLTGTGRSIVFGDEAESGELSPVETVAATLAACSAMDVIAILIKKRQRVESYTVSVSAVQRSEYPQVLTRIEVVHEVAGAGISEEAVRRAIELSATTYCPVSAMLSAGETEIHHRYVVRATGAAPSEASGEVVVTGPYRRPEVVRG
ncbi:MAG TPA: OsmC family protein [Candidatus Limnocylindrales bacterium]|nr:OsmC family protein [Candidatus Limnocylindrales bacterium]